MDEMGCLKKKKIKKIKIFRVDTRGSQRSIDIY